jgi:hypothetical protein
VQAEKIDGEDQLYKRIVQFDSFTSFSSRVPRRGLMPVDLGNPRLQARAIPRAVVQQPSLSACIHCGLNHANLCLETEEKAMVPVLPVLPVLPV